LRCSVCSPFVVLRHGVALPYSPFDVAVCLPFVMVVCIRLFVLPLFVFVVVHLLRCSSVLERLTVVALPFVSLFVCSRYVVVVRFVVIPRVVLRCCWCLLFCSFVVAVTRWIVLFRCFVALLLLCCSLVVCVVVYRLRSFRSLLLLLCVCSVCLFYATLLFVVCRCVVVVAFVPVVVIWYVVALLFAVVVDC